MRPYRAISKETNKEVKGWYAIISNRHLIITNKAKSQTGDSYWFRLEGFVEVIPETVGQFTGRHDKKRTKEYPEGEEIYTDSLLLTPGGQKLRVEIANLIDGDGKFRSIDISECEVIHDKEQK